MFAFFIPLRTSGAFSFIADAPPLYCACVLTYLAFQVRRREVIAIGWVLTIRHLKSGF